MTEMMPGAEMGKAAMVHNEAVGGPSELDGGESQMLRESGGGGNGNVDESGEKDGEGETEDAEMEKEGDEVEKTSAAEVT